MTRKMIAQAPGLLPITGAVGAWYSKSKTPVAEPPRFRAAAVGAGNGRQTAARRITV